MPAVDSGLTQPPTTGAPRALAAAARAFERLAPDRRFTLAFEEVDRILGGAPTTQARESAISQLPVSPDFEPLMDAVASYAAARALPATPKGAEVAPGSDAVEIPIGHQAVAALSAADDAWKTPAERPLAARRAAIALVGLVFGTYDRLEVADELPARAIAAVALARALGARAPASVEALLARTLGYGAAAIRLAPPNVEDAAAAYAADDDARLLRLAHGSPFAKNAWLRRLEHREDPAAIRAWLDHELPTDQTTVQVLAAQSRGGAGLEIQAMLMARFPAIALAEAIDASSDLAQDAGAARGRVTASLTGGDDRDRALAAVGTTRQQVLVAYDAAIAALPRRSGPFRDTGLERDYLDTNMVAAMTAVERYHVEAYGSPKDATREVNELAEPTAPRTKAFRTYFTATVAATAAPSPDEAIAHVSAVSPLGGNARVILLDLLKAKLHEPIVTRVSRALLTKLDSRPRHRLEAGISSATMMKNARVAEAFYRSASAVSGGADATADAEVIYRDRDPDAVVRFAKRTASPPRHRAAVVAWAMAHNIGDRVALDKFADDLVREAPTSWSVRSAFLATYTKTDRKRAKGMIQQFLDSKAGAANGGLGEVFPRIALARVYRREKKYPEAIRALEPASATWQATAMVELAVTHAEAGHFADAEKLALRTLERYPQAASASVVLARIRWIKRDMTGAADAIANAPRRLTGYEITELLAPVFADVLYDKDADAARAADALRAANVGRAVNDIAKTLIRRRWFATALAVLQPKPEPRAFTTPRPAPGSADPYPAETRALTFEALLAVKGKEAASAWLRAEVGTDPRKYAETIYQAFQRGVFDALDVEGPPGGSPEALAEALALRLAAQLRHDGKITIADEARKAFAATPDARYSSYGRYLLGDIDADTVEKLAASPKQTCELAYFMAVKATGDGRHGDAIDLMRVALDTNSTRDGEYQWAEHDLGRYLHSLRALGSLPAGLPGLPAEVVAATP